MSDDTSVPRITQRAIEEALAALNSSVVGECLWATNTLQRMAPDLARLAVAVPSLEAAKSALQSQVRFYQEREAFFATALRVADGGQYRNDWPSAIERVLCENEALRAQVQSHEDADRRWSADMEALRRELQAERDFRAQMVADSDARSGEPL